jgi:hypothetical protein
MAWVTKEGFWKIYWSFHNSEVILWSRIQLFVGVVWTVLSQTDLAPLISDPRYLTYWLIANGVITEMLRRRGADYNFRHPEEAHHDDDCHDGDPK